MKRAIALAVAVFGWFGSGYLHAAEDAKASDDALNWLDDLATEGEEPKQASEASAQSQTQADAPVSEARPESTPQPAAPVVSEAPIAAQATTEQQPPEGQPQNEPAAPYPQTIPVPQTATSADPASPPRKTGRAIEEITVTARRTEENLQDVPIAVTAMNAEALQREQINNAQDLQGRVPSLVIGANSQTRNTESLTLRGQGSSFGANPGVVMYFAEVPIAADFPFSGQGGPGKFFDAANLQVLKGAQGTLFGRNTTGGALLIEPQKPQNEFSASLSAEGSNYAGQNYEGVVNIPLVDDTLLFRAGVKYVDREGFTKEVKTGETLDDRHFWAGRVGLSWKPTDSVESSLFAHYTYSNDNGTGLVMEDINSEGLNYGIPVTLLSAAGADISPLVQVLLSLGIPVESATDIAGSGCAFFNVVTPSTNCGQDIVAEQRARGIRSIETSLLPKDEIESGAIIHHLSIDLSDNVTLRNIASYSLHSHLFNWDADGSRAKMQDLSTPDGFKAYDISQTTEELQLQGTAFDERLKFVIGGFYMRERPEGPMQQIISAFGLTLAPTSYARRTDSYAPYAQATYDLGGLFSALDGLSFTGGIRHTTDKSEGWSDAGGGTLPTMPGPVHTAEVEDGALTYTAGLDYKLEHSLIYGKISRGYKSGGFSPAAVVPQDYTYAPEFVFNYEVGLKTDLLIGEMPARINASLYYTDYTDMQRAGVDADGGSIGAAIFTAGSATIQGLEFEATLQPTDNLTLAGNYSYTEGKYNEFNLIVNRTNPQLDCTGELVTRGGVVDLSCVPFQYTPRNQFSVTAAYELPIDTSVGDVSASLTYSWSDDQYASSYTLPETEPGAWLDAFGLFNATVSWERIAGSNLDLLFFGTNLTDEVYRISNSNVWELAYYRSSIYGEPRIIGARLAYRWGN